MNRVRPSVFVSLLALAALCATSMGDANGTESLRNAIRHSLGRKVVAGSRLTEADLNGDGVVNVLDAALLRLREGGKRNGLVGNAAQVAGTEQVVVEPDSVKTLAGNQVAVLFLLRGNTTPLLGYTLDVTATASAEGIGMLVPNVSATNFFDARNVITAGGATRDPFFSVIESDGAGGITITTMTNDLSTVLALDGVNDVLAEVVFDVPPDTEGEFLLTLGATSAISDGNGSPIPFTFIPGTVRVFDPAEVPAVSEWGIGVLGLTLLAIGTIVIMRGTRSSSTEDSLSVGDHEP